MCPQPIVSIRFDLKSKLISSDRLFSFFNNDEYNYYSYICFLNFKFSLTVVQYTITTRVDGDVLEVFCSCVAQW